MSFLAPTFLTTGLLLLLSRTLEVASLAGTVLEVLEVLEVGNFVK